MRGTTYVPRELYLKFIISIHVPREGDDVFLLPEETAPSISIHVPREGDDQKKNIPLSIADISIHVPREGDDVEVGGPAFGDRIFQSTSPVRGTTRLRRGYANGRSYFNPRPP